MVEPSVTDSMQLEANPVHAIGSKRSTASRAFSASESAPPVAGNCNTEHHARQIRPITVMELKPNSAWYLAGHSLTIGTLSWAVLMTS